MGLREESRSSLPLVPALGARRLSSRPVESCRRAGRTRIKTRGRRMVSQGRRGSQTGGRLEPGTQENSPPSMAGSARGPAPSVPRQCHRQLEYLVTVIASEVDLNRRRIDVHIPADHLEQLATQRGQVVGGTARTSLLCDDDAQALLGDIGRRRSLAKKSEEPHVSLQTCVRRTPSWVPL